MVGKLLKTALVFMVVLLVFSFPAQVLADEDDPEVTPESNAVPSRVIVADHYIEGGGLAAGETGTAVFVLKNTSETSNVSGLLVSGWIADGEPVEFDGVNQAYVPLLLPGSQTAVELKYFARNVDMTTVRSVSVGLTVSYKDEGSGIDRTNNISLRLPVIHTSYPAVSEADMRWQTPAVSAFDEYLTSRLMQVVYMAGLIICFAGSVILLLFKTKVLRYKR